MRRTFASVIALSAVAGIASLAGAAPTFNFAVNYNGSLLYSTATNPGTFTVNPGPGGTWVVSGSYAAGPAFFNFDLTLKDDPFATSNFNLTNTSGALGHFTTSLSLAVNSPLAAPITSQGSISGSIGDNSLTFDGASLDTLPGSAFYTATIDGAPFKTLYPDPSNVTAFGGLTETLNATGFSNLAAFQPTATIGIINDFTLTADDSVGMISRFDVTPTPGAVSVFGLAGLVAARRRR